MLGEVMITSYADGQQPKSSFHHCSRFVRDAKRLIKVYRAQQGIGILYQSKRNDPSN